MTIFEYDALLFDLDGVLTSTAALHEDAWKSMFDEFLTWRAETRSLRPFLRRSGAGCGPSSDHTA